MDRVRRGHFLLILLILIIQVPFFTSHAQQQCEDISTMRNDNNEYYNDPNDTSAVYTTYSIKPLSLTPKCIEMQIREDNTEVRFDWKKNGGKDTDLSFYIKNNSKTDFEIEEVCKGSESCIIADWTRKPKSYFLNKGDVLKWEFWVRNTNLPEKGKACVAICSKISAGSTEVNRRQVDPIHNESSQIQPPPVPVIRGQDHGYVGDDLQYSVDLRNYNHNHTVNYQFEWDGQVDNPSTEEVAPYRWETRGEKTVRVRAIDEQGHWSEWSVPIKSRIIEKIKVDSTPIGIEYIYNCSNYTELVLIDKEYVLDREIEIINKKYLTITSIESHAMLLGRYLLDRMINIRDSNHIVIKNLNISNAKIGVKLDKCDNCSLSDNIIKFGGSWYGIKLCSGNGNKVDNNHIEYTDIPCIGNEAAIAIKVENGKDISVVGNAIKYKDASPLSYDIEKNEDTYRNITIILPNDAENLGIRFGNCFAFWGYSSGIIERGECAINDNDNRPNVWHIE